MRSAPPYAHKAIPGHIRPHGIHQATSAPPGTTAGMDSEAGLDPFIVQGSRHNSAPSPRLQYHTSPAGRRINYSCRADSSSAILGSWACGPAGCVGKEMKRRPNAVLAVCLDLW
jgi:hypothetical protein